MGNIDLLQTLEFLPGIIIGLTLHEFSHAWVANYCGDSTAKEQGRISINPLKHIDPLGFLLLIVAGFGWAKPVQFNEQNLKNPKIDVMKIAVAGPLSNAAIAMILSIAYSLIFSHQMIYPSRSMQIVSDILLYGISINWALLVFNLIPLPPLDGSHLLLSQFKKFPALYEGLYKYGSFILFGLVIASFVTKINFIPIMPVVRFLGNGFFHIIGFSL